MKNSSVDDCKIVELNKISNRQGNITVLENNQSVLSGMPRIFYTYDIPGGASRGAHAHKELQQLLVAVCGSFEVLLDDGVRKRSVMLHLPNKGLLVSPGIWSRQANFSSGAVCLVIASDLYKEEDYIRDYTDFLEYKTR